LRDFFTMLLTIVVWSRRERECAGALKEHKCLTDEPSVSRFTRAWSGLQGHTSDSPDRGSPYRSTHIQETRDPVVAVEIVKVNAVGILFIPIEEHDASEMRGHIA
jgi:hypothetical protein